MLGREERLRVAQIDLDGVAFADSVKLVVRHVRDQGLAADGVAGPNTRKALYAAYMDVLCRDDAGAPFKLEKSHFLGRGEDPDGKVDYQGCSAFDPVKVFSQVR